MGIATTPTMTSMVIEAASPRSSTPAQRSVTGVARGFTLLEMLVTVATLAIVAAIALPSYIDYITRSKIVEATSGLNEMRVRLEQFFADNRQYPTACLASAAGPPPAKIYLPGLGQVLRVQLHAVADRVHGHRDRRCDRRHGGLRLHDRPGERAQDDKLARGLDGRRCV